MLSYCSHRYFPFCSFCCLDKVTEKMKIRKLRSKGCKHRNEFEQSLKIHNDQEYIRVPIENIKETILRDFDDEEEVEKVLIIRLLYELFSSIPGYKTNLRPKVSKESISKSMVYHFSRLQYNRIFKANFDINISSFGKVVKLCFPNVTTHRIGSKIHSRYSYKGLKINEKYLGCVSAEINKFNELNDIFIKNLNNFDINYGLDLMNSSYWGKRIIQCDVLTFEFCKIINEQIITRMLELFETNFENDLDLNLIVTPIPIFKQLIASFKKFLTGLLQLEIDSELLKSKLNYFLTFNYNYEINDFFQRIKVNNNNSDVFELIKFKIIEFLVEVIIINENDQGYLYLYLNEFNTLIIKKMLKVQYFFGNFLILNNLIIQYSQIFIELRKLKSLIP